MRPLLPLFAVLLLVLPAALPTAPAVAMMPGRFFVGFTGSIPPDARPLLESLGATVLAELPAINVVFVHANDGATLKSGLSQDPRIRYVVEEGRGARPYAQPTDPDLAAGFQDYLAAQKIPAAWAAGLDGSQNVVTIAIIDRGLRTTHPDLAPNLWTHPTTGQHGFNLVHPDPNQFGAIYLDGNVEDTDGHGTLVAGVAAAAWNSVGIAGVAGKAKIMPIRAWGDENLIVRGIILAVDNGARVIVVPQGLEAADAPTGFPNSLDPPYPALRDAVRYARSRNVVVVAAAGNAQMGETRPAYPAAFTETLAVTALDVSPTGTLSAPLDYRRGSSIDLAAPHNVWTTCAASGASRDQASCGTCPVRPAAGSASEGLTCGVTGTSFSAPQVGGVAALMVSCRPLLTADNVATILTGTAIDVTQGDAATGFDNASGHGAVNATKVRDWIAPCGNLPWTGPPTSGSSSGGGDGGVVNPTPLYTY